MLGIFPVVSGCTSQKACFHPCLSTVNTHETFGGLMVCGWTNLRRQRRLQERLRVENVVSEEAMVNSMDIIVMNGNEIQSSHEAPRMDH